MTEFPQLDPGIAILVFTQGDDPIACLNKAMAFLSAVAASRFPSTNNQLITTSNKRNQATIQDGRVTVQQVQGRQGQSYAGIINKGNTTSSRGYNAEGQVRVVKCYNCQGEGHMARQCTQPKSPRNSAWFKDKAMLAEAHESGQILDEEQLAFLADPSIPDGQAAQTTIPNNVAFQTEDLDAYDSDCDDVISEVPYSEPYHNDMDNQSVHAMRDFEQTPVVNFPFNEITSDSNIILYSQYLQETQQAAVQDTNLYAQQDSMILSMIEQMSKQMINHIKPTLYDGSVISSQHVVISVIDDEETLILEEVSRSKMLAKQNGQISKENKINTTPINYVELNQLSEDFGKCFVPTEQAFWLQTSNPNTEQSDISPGRIEAPSELPKVSLVNTSIKKLKIHLSKFDTVVKKQITPDAITEEEWGFEHTKAVFLNEIIPFLTTLKDIFNVFDGDLLNEVTEVQTVFNQIETTVQQCSDILLSVMNSTTVYGDSVNLKMQSSESCDKCFDLEAEL
ncbi:retrovirus-related pol polyprotein from transposon TNT 1-94 [Tanacetum coccineum]